MGHREIDIKQPHKLRVCQNRLHDALSRESFFPETDFDTVKDFGVRCIGFVEDVLER